MPFSNVVLSYDDTIAEQAPQWGVLKIRSVLLSSVQSRVAPSKYKNVLQMDRNGESLGYLWQLNEGCHIYALFDRMFVFNICMMIRINMILEGRSDVVDQKPG